MADHSGVRMVFLLRVGALAIVLTGLVGAIIWGLDLRRTGSGGLVAGIAVGTFLAAALTTGIAYIMDLLAFARRSESARA